MLETEYTVVGCGRFPIDMLRYDCAFPASGADAACIAATFGPDASAEVAVTLRRNHDSKAARKSWHPEAGRWESFGWVVSEKRR